MKKIVTAILFTALGAIAGAQTVIERYTAGGHPEGTFYYLPKTALRISIMVEKTQYTPGSMCMYADKYLRIKNVRQTADVSHKVIGIRISPYAVADTAKCYTVKYNGKSVGTNMQLSEDGCLLAVNTENTVPAPPTEFTPSPKPQLPSPNSYLSEEILSAGSTAKMAQLIAQDIYDIRDSKNQLTRGQADFMPKDGEQLRLMLAQLTAQENAMASMFTGTVERDTVEHIINICPMEETGKQILFRLSKQLGMVDSDDLSGTPYYIYIGSGRKHAAVVNTHHLGTFGGVATEYKQQFLALIIHRHDVYLSHMSAEVCHRLVPVKHGRQLYHDRLCLLKQQRQKGNGVGSAVGNGKGAPAVSVAPRRVEIDYINRSQVAQALHTVATHHLGMSQPQQGEVVAGNGTQLRIALNIRCLGKTGGKIGEIHSKAPGKVGKAAGTGGRMTGASSKTVGTDGRAAGTGSEQRCLIKGGLLAGTLLHGQRRRIKHALHPTPLRQLAARLLIARNLL